MIAKNTDYQVADELANLNGDKTIPWVVDNAKLHKTFQFRNFVSAFGFMAQVAIEAEKANHHPEWCNVYKRVTFDLTTHEVGGISAKDFELAKVIEGIADS